jgi:hypothetical protein
LEYNETVHQPLTDVKKAFDSVRREDLYNIHIKFGVPMKLVRLIKTCLDETYIKVCIGKQSVLKRELCSEWFNAQPHVVRLIQFVFLSV